MSLTVQALTRQFMFNGVQLTDIDPKMTPEQIRDLYAATYPQLTAATVEGPVAEGDVLLYTFEFAAGSKG